MTTTATSTVNFDVNLTKGSSSTYRDAVQAAFGGRLAEGDPLAASYNHATWSSDQTHHLIAQNVVKDDPILTKFFDDVRNASIGSPGGAYVYDINNIGNLIDLPTNNAVRTANTSVSAALHNGSSAEHQAYDAFTKKSLLYIAKQYQDSLDNLGQPGFPAYTPEARQDLALKAAAQVEDFQQTLRGGLFGKTPGDIKYFVNINDDILINRYAAQGYGSMTAEQRRIFLEQNVYNANPTSIVSQGDVLKQTLPDGRSETRFLTEDALNRYLNDTTTKNAVNGVPKEVWVAERDRIAADLQQKSPGLSLDQAHTKALVQLNEAVTQSALNQYFENHALNGTEKLFGNSLDTTPEGIERQKGALAFLQKVAEHPGVQFAGKALSVVGLMVMVTETKAALNEGNTAKAQSIVANWAAEEAGGWIAGGLAVVGMTAVAVTFSLPASVAGLLILSAGLIGGYVGGEVSKTILNSGLDALKGSLDMAALRQAMTAQNNGNDLGLDYSQASSQAAQNPTTFDLSVDPSGLKPTTPDSLGSSTHGWGLLAGGAAYNAAMSSIYVNGSGLANTVASNLVADGTRPGNHSLNGTVDLTNALRAINFSRHTLELSAPDTLSPEQEAEHISLLMQAAQDAENIAYTDPLSLDVGNDGIRMSANPVNFDLNADGSPEALSWTAPTDPLLVLDVNGDGRINHGSELVDLTNSDVPLNLFSLDSLDKGGDGDQILNANDSAFAQLQLWTDRNQDGYASAEERQSLAELGIVSIDLNPAHLQASSIASPIAGQTGIKGVVATYADGSHKTLWDVPLLPNANSSAPITTSAYGSSGAIDKITGSGQTALVAKSAFGVAINLQGSGADQAIGSFGNDTLIGTNGNDWLTGGAGADSFNAGAGADLLIIDADDQQTNIDAGTGIDTILVADDRGVFLNLAKTHSEVIYGGYGDDVFVGGGADNYFIDGAAGDDLIIGGSVDDVLSGGDGADVLEGLAGDDLIRGHRGNDQLLGGDGNDVLDGGLDNDTLQAGNGNDVILASGGTDTVDGGSGIDMLELQGHLEDYSFIHNDTVANGSWTITDHKNNDGKPVPAGQVSNRNGVQQINHVERFSFMSGQTPTAKALKIAA